MASMGSRPMEHTMRIIKPFLSFLLAVSLRSFGGGRAALPKDSDAIDGAVPREPPQIMKPPPVP